MTSLSGSEMTWRPETDRQTTLRVGQLSCAAIVVRLPNGDQAIGTAFHVGQGVNLTARHVLEGNEIIEFLPLHDGWLFRHELASETDTLVSLEGRVPIWHIHHDNPHITRGPFFHSDPRVDVTVFVAGGLDFNTPAMALGMHYDDWIVDRDFLLTTGVAFGYPPIPMSKSAIQLVATVEVNAVVDTYLDRYVRFIASGPPRGGFSGGPVFHEYGFVLEMIT